MSAFIKLNSIPTLAQLWHRAATTTVAAPAGSSTPSSSGAPLLDRLSLWKGDITTLEVDAIVNAAAEPLRGGGGVDGAIHRAAGPDLLKECIQVGGCPTGEVRMTRGYRLPAAHVIHTVGPVGERPELLRRCYVGSLDCLVDHGLRTVAFPCISTGVFGYPPRNAAKLVVATVKAWMETDGHINQVDRIIFCVHSKTDHDIYQECLTRAFLD